MEMGVAEDRLGRTYTEGVKPDVTSRNTAHVGTTAPARLLLALSFCRAVYGLTFRKGRSRMLLRNNEVKPLAAC
jgi:hypothetical protein